MFDRVKRVYWNWWFRMNFITCGELFSCGRPCYIYRNGGGTLQIGHRLSLNRNVTISAADGGEVFIGNDVKIGQNTVIISSNHDIRNHAEHVPGKVVIGDDVWIGANCVVLPDVKIGSGAIIGAGSIVTKDIPENALVVGNPGRVIRLTK